MSASSELAIKITGSPGNVQQVMNDVTRALGGIPNVAKSVTGALGSIVDGLGKVGLAGMGIKALADGAKGLGDALGVGLNSQMEQASAAINAFTKNGDQTAKILADIRQEANATPFAFQEMANATASLLPVAKASGAGLMDLVKQAEILAASNPLEGLEGASFALKEAVSGDFTSVIERFNLSRTTLNKLKDQGVPALEAVTIAMKEMGYDSDLVSAKANTLEGRWSTFLDTIDTVKSTIGKPIFDALKDGLMGVQSLLDSNMDGIQAFAQGVADNIGRVITIGKALVAAFTVDKGAMGIVIAQLREMFGDDFANAIEPFVQAFMDAIPSIQAFVANVIAQVQQLQQNIATTFGNVVTLIQAFIASFTTDAGAMGIVLDMIRKIFGDGVANAVEPFIQGFMKAIPAIQAFVTMVGQWLDTFGRILQQAFRGDVSNALNNFLVTLGNVAGTLGPILASWGQAFVDWIGPKIPAMLAALGDLVGKVWGWIQEQAPGWIAQLQAWGQAFIDWITPMLPPLLDKLGEMLGGLLQWVSEHTGPIKDTLVEWGAAFVSWLADKGPDIISAVGDFVAGLLNQIDQRSPEIGAEVEAKWVPALAGWAAAAIVQLVKTFALLNTAILNEIGKIALSALGAALRIGVDLMQGIKNGIDQMNSWLLDAMKELGANILKGIMAGLTNSSALNQQVVDLLGGLLAVAQHAIDAHSPSRVWAEKVGQPMALGVEQGFTDALPDVATSITDGLGKLLAGVGSTINVTATDTGKVWAEAIAQGFEAALPVVNGRIQGALGGIVKSTAGRAADIGRSVSAGMVVGSPEDIAKALGSGGGDVIPVHNRLLPAVPAAPSFKSFFPDLPRSFVPGSGGGGGTSITLNQTIGSVSSDVDMERHNGSAVDALLRAQRYQDAAGSRPTVLEMSR